MKQQAGLEAEVTSLRQSLEEKDGLIDALRQALRAAASTSATDRQRQKTAGRSTNTDSPESVGDNSRGGSSRSLSGRTRSARLLLATGPVATAEAEAAATTAAAAATARAREAASSTTSLHRMRDVRPQTERRHVSDQDRDIERSKQTPVVSQDEGFALLLPINSSRSSRSSSSSTEEEVRQADSGADGLGSDGASTTPAYSDPAPDGGATTPSDIAVSPSTEASQAKEEEGGAAAAVGGSGGDDGVVSRATAVPGAAWRVVWGSARAVGSTVGIRRSASGTPKALRRRGGSSHAVLIL